MRLLSSLSGDPVQIMRDVTHDLARAMRRGVAAAGAAVHEELLAQMVGSVPLQGLNDLFRVTIFPTEGTAAQNTLMPAAVVSPRKPKVVMALVDPIEIVARNGRYMTFPTPNNQRPDGTAIVSIGDMVRARGQTFVIVPRENPAVKIWCLRGGATVDLATLRRDAMARRLGRQMFPGERGPVMPAFYLVRSVKPRRHIDLDAVRRAAGPILGDRIAIAMQEEGIA